VSPPVWKDLPTGTFTKVGPRTYSLSTNGVPAGEFQFRIVTVIQGGQTLVSPITEPYLFTAAPPEPAGLETRIKVTSAADSSGETTHRGDTLTYEISYRVKGTTPPTNLVVGAFLPLNTRPTKWDKGAKFYKLSPTVGDEVRWRLGTVAPSTTWKTLRCSAQVREPSQFQLDRGITFNNVGDVLSSFSYINSGTKYEGSPVAAQSTVILPLEIEATRLGSSSAKYEPGEMVRIFFKLKNGASYMAKRATLKVHQPTLDLSIQDAGDGPQFVDSSKQPIGYPKDGKTGQQVRVVPGFKTNPALEDSLTEGQTAHFAYGHLKAQDERFAIVTFRVPWDFPVETEPVIISRAPNSPSSRPGATRWK
jgi:uncharacterized repeat protein (TIGR01451 family)